MGEQERRAARPGRCGRDRLRDCDSDLPRPGSPRSVRHGPGAGRSAAAGPLADSERLQRLGRPHGPRSRLCRDSPSRSAPPPVPAAHPVRLRIQQRASSARECARPRGSAGPGARDGEPAPALRPVPEPGGHPVRRLHLQGARPGISGARGGRHGRSCAPGVRGPSGGPPAHPARSIGAPVYITRRGPTEG